MTQLPANQPTLRTRCGMTLRLSALLVLAPWHGAQAQPAPVPTPLAEPRTWLQVQALAGSWQQRSRGDQSVLFGNTQNGTPFSAEGDLGLPRHRVLPSLVFGRLIGQHWRIEIDHSSARGKGTTVLSRELAVDGTVFPAGTTLQSDLGLSTLGVLGGWSGQVGPDTDAGVLLGGQWVSVSRRFFSATSSAGPARESGASDAAPLPVLGFFGRHRLADNWRANGRITFSKSGNYQATAAAQWQANRHLALGLGYRVTRHKLNVQSVSFIGCCDRLVLDARIHGPMLSATLSF